MVGEQRLQRQGQEPRWTLAVSCCPPTGDGKQLHVWASTPKKRPQLQTLLGDPVLEPLKSAVSGSPGCYPYAFLCLLCWGKEQPDQEVGGTFLGDHLVSREVLSWTPPELGQGGRRCWRPL